MGRPRRQEPRRAQLIAATQRVLARDGLVGLRVREVAAEAGMSPASVLYYFPDSFQLAVQAMDQAAHACATERAAVAASIPDPAQRVVALVMMDIPDPLPGIRRAFCEIPGQVTDHPELAALIDFVLRDQIAVMQAAIEDGAASGAFVTAGDPELLARGIVANLHAINPYRVCGLETAQQARARMLAHLECALGCALPVAPAHRRDPRAATPEGAERPAPAPAPSATATPDPVDVHH
jgi:AcrR family transcriptional regulator